MTKISDQEYNEIMDKATSLVRRTMDEDPEITGFTFTSVMAVAYSIVCLSNGMTPEQGAKVVEDLMLTLKIRREGILGEGAWKK